MDSYSRELMDEKLLSIHDKLDAILTQTTRTNGRVTECEGRITAGEWWTRGIAVLIPIVIALVGYIYVTSEKSIAQAQDVQDTRIENLIKQVNHLP